jgi:glutaredoxin
MKKLLFLLIIGGALWHYRAQLPWNNSASGAFNADGSPGALLITSDDCGKPCEMMEKNLDRMHVNYQRKLIHYDNPDEITELHRYTNGANILPVFVVGKQVTRGYNEFELPFDVADVLGVDYLPAEQAEIIRKTHFNADGSKKVVLYGTAWCGYCKKARELLDSKGIRYEDVDVERSGESMRHFKTLGGNGYPLIFVGARAMSGYEQQKLLELASAK